MKKNDDEEQKIDRFREILSDSSHFIFGKSVASVCL